MICHEYQDQLQEHLGQDRLPDDLARHLDDCSECNQVWKDLLELGGHLGQDSVFYPETEESELVARVIEREVRATTTVTVVRPVWLVRLSAVAAAALLLISTGLVVERYSGRQVRTSADTTSAQVADSGVPAVQNEDDEMPAETINLLIREVSTRGTFEAGDQLLDDLSDDEVSYLKTALKAGDLL